MKRILTFAFALLTRVVVMGQGYRAQRRNWNIEDGVYKLNRALLGATLKIRFVAK